MFIVKSKGKEIEKLCKTCLKNKLYIKGRLGQSYMSDPDYMKVFSVLYDDKKPVAWCMIYETSYYGISDNILGVYVHPDYRGRKFGQLLIENTLLYYPDKIVFDEASVQYYEKIESIQNYWKSDNQKRFDELPETERVEL